MKGSFRFFVSATALALASCGSDSPTPTQPAAVAPTPVPTPRPSPSPPQAFGARARVIGFTRAGQRYAFVPGVFRRQDVIDLDCGPLDSLGRFIDDYPNFGEWYPNSDPNGLVFNRDYTMARDNTLQPDLFIRSIAPAGTIRIFCKVAGFNSNTLNLPVVAQ